MLQIPDDKFLIQASRSSPRGAAMHRVGSRSVKQRSHESKVKIDNTKFAYLFCSPHPLSFSLEKGMGHFLIDLLRFYTLPFLHLSFQSQYEMIHGNEFIKLSERKEDC